MSDMTETELTMPMNFEENHVFILYPNPKVVTIITESMASSYLWYDKIFKYITWMTSKIHQGCCQLHI